MVNQWSLLGGTLIELIHQKSDCNLRVIHSFRYVFTILDHKSYTQNLTTFSLIPTPEGGNSGINHGPISTVQFRIFDQDTASTHVC